MAKALDKPRGRMTVDQFLSWAMAQPDGPRYELVDGEVVVIAPERAAHARRKARIWRALSDAIDAASLVLRGAAGRHDGQDRRAHGLRARRGLHGEEALPDDAVIVPAPVIVVEVLSPSTATRDTGAKLADYVRLPSLRHYLIVRTDRSTVIHHRQGVGQLIETRIVTSGGLLLDPPGITLDLDRIYG